MAYVRVCKSLLVKIFMRNNANDFHSCCDTAFSLHWSTSNNNYVFRGPTEDIISYFTLMSSEIHYYDIIEKMGSWTLMSSEV